MPKEKMSDVIAQRDALDRDLTITRYIMSCLANGEIPDVEDKCDFPDGVTYKVRVYGVERSHGGVAHISREMVDTTTTHDAQYFERAVEAARATRSSNHDAWAYREMWDRLESKVRRMHATRDLYGSK